MPRENDVTETAGKSRIQLVEAGRGLAALLVVVHHAGNMVAQERFSGVHVFAGHLRNFNVGVDFFFVLSGFIIAWTHWADIGERAAVGRYARKRFLRIYPAYWGVLVPLILLYAFVPTAGLPSQRDPINVVCSILLAPCPDAPVLGVAWTLTHEMAFYVLFAAIIWLGRASMVLLPIWAALILGVHFLDPLPYPFTFLLNPYNIEFLLGVAAAAALRRWRIPAPAVLLSVGTAAFLGFLLFGTDLQSDPLVGRLAFGLPAALFIVGAVELERRRPVRLPAAMLFMGGASYAIYLVHPVALSLSTTLLYRLSPMPPAAEVAVLVIAIFATAAGVTYAVLIEPRLTQLVRFALDRRSGRPAASALALADGRSLSARRAKP